MKHINLIFSLILTTLVIGCAKASYNNDPAAAAEGVSQGNGMTTYASNFKYTISYMADLQLVIKSDREIEINDSTLVNQAEGVSTLTLKALDDSDFAGKTFDTAEQLLNHLSNKEPSTNWTKIQQPGSLGFSSEVASTDFTSTEFYFFSEEKYVIYGHMKISNRSRNGQHIKAVMSTFSMDYEAPTVSDIKLQTTTVKTGQYGNILFKASDDISGISLDASTVTGIFTLNGTIGPEFRIIGYSIEALADNWYSVQFKVEDGIPAGSYALVSFCVEDNVGNKVSLSLFNDIYCRPNDAVTTAVELPPVNLVISNPDATDAPQTEITDLKRLQDTVK